MKTALLAVTFSMYAHALFSQNIKKLEENNGFKKYKLGSKYQAVYGIKGKLEDNSEKVVIAVPGEKISDIDVQRIELIYINDTLCRVYVYAEPHKHAPLLDACKASFGASPKDLSDNEASRKQQNIGKTSEQYTDQYLWQGTKINLQYFYLYPKTEGGWKAAKDLCLLYSLNDFKQRLQRAGKKYKASDF